MKMKSNIYRNTLYFSLFLAVVAVICGIGFCRKPPEPTTTMKLGGLRNTAQNSGEIESMGRFAVQQYNKNQVFFFSIHSVFNFSTKIAIFLFEGLKWVSVDPILVEYR